MRCQCQEWRVWQLFRQLCIFSPLAGFRILAPTESDGMTEPRIQTGQVLQGPLFNEPMRVETVRPLGNGGCVAGLVGTGSHVFRRVTLSSSDLVSLTVLEPALSYDGDGKLLRLGLQAYARRHEDALLLDLALTVERAHPWPLVAPCAPM